MNSTTNSKTSKMELCFWSWLLLLVAQSTQTTVSVSVRQRIQMAGDENGVGGRVRFLAYRLVVRGVFFNFGFEGRNGL